MYNAAKHLSNFIFEKKMPTTVGGTANIDSYYNAPECHIFVEAKCREPYGEKRNIISRKYEELYKHISDSPKTITMMKTIVVLYIIFSVLTIWTSIILKH
jgi:hypothetical protein